MSAKSKKKLSLKKFIISFGLVAVCALIACAVFLAKSKRLKTDAADAEEIASFIDIKGVRYTQTNKMQFLQVVPDASYDELSMFVSDDAGDVSWNMLTAWLKEDYDKYANSSATDSVTINTQALNKMVEEAAQINKSISDTQALLDEQVTSAKSISNEAYTAYLNKTFDGYLNNKYPNYDFSKYPFDWSQKANGIDPTKFYANYYNNPDPDKKAEVDAIISIINKEQDNYFGKSYTGYLDPNSLKAKADTEYDNAINNLANGQKDKFIAAIDKIAAYKAQIASSKAALDVKNASIEALSANISKQESSAWTKISDISTSSAPTAATALSDYYMAVANAAPRNSSGKYSLYLFNKKTNTIIKNYNGGGAENIGGILYTLGEALDYDPSNLGLVIGYTDDEGNTEPVTYKLDTDPAGTVRYARDLLSFKIFDNTCDGEGKLQVVYKLAEDVTKEDIDRSILIKACDAHHNPANYKHVLDYYKIKDHNQYTSRYNTKDLKFSGEHDLRAEIAYYLLNKNNNNERIFLYDTDNKLEVDTNIGDICLIQTGIDYNRFIVDFDTYLAGTETYNGREWEYYAGNAGEFWVEKSNNSDLGSLSLYYYTFDEDTGESLGYEQMPWAATMFILENGKDLGVYGYHGYCPNGNNVSKYPAYNATSGDMRQSNYLSKNSFQVNSNNYFFNSIFSDEAVTEATKDKIDEFRDTDGVTYYLTDTAYSDCKQKLGKTGDISVADVIRYLLGAYGDKHFVTPENSSNYTINVLEIEPTGVGIYNDGTDAVKEQIKKWYGWEDFDVTDADGKVLKHYSYNMNINVKEMSMNEFIGYTEDIASDFDLVIMGDWNGKEGKPILNPQWFQDGIVYQPENITENRPTSPAVNGDDITVKAVNKLVKYVKQGLPIVLDKDIYTGSYDRVVYKNGQRVKETVKSTVSRDTVLYKMMRMSQLEKLVGGAATNIYETNIYDTMGSQTIKGSLSYYMKPEIKDVASSLKEYSASDGNVGISNVNVADQLENLTFKGTVNAPTPDFVGSDYRVKLYIDRNCDSMFNEDTTSNKAELMEFARDDNNQPLKDSYGNILGKKFTYNEDGSFEMTVSLPTALEGYIGWKMEVTDVSRGSVKVYKGAFAIYDLKKKSVNVLQIVDDSSKTSGGSLSLKDNSAFLKCFAKTIGVTGHDIKIDIMTKSEFNRNPSIINDTKNGGYSILVLGFLDSYGASMKLDDNAIAQIQKYIYAGNSALFTHDTMSFSKDGDTGLNICSNYSGVAKFTRVFKQLIGCKGNGNGPTYLDDSMYSLTDIFVTRYLGTQRAYGTHTGVYTTDYMGSYTNNRMFTTTKVNRLNRGEITEYPYAISSSIPVATTHSQYYSLDLESRNENPQIYDDDVVVWYTLGNTSAAFTGGNKVYDVMGKDGVNNYYVYSKGNITFSSAGHSTVSDPNSFEMKLFVNTFIRAMLSGHSKPNVVINDAEYGNDGMYTKYYRADLSTKTGDTDIQFDFTVNDPDVVAGTGKLSSTFIYYDRNRNNVYDAGTDKIISYVTDDGVSNDGVRYAKILTEDSGRNSETIISGDRYRFNLWEAARKMAATGKSEEFLTNVDLADMYSDLANNSLVVGVNATSIGNQEAFAEVKFTERELFKLE